MRRTPCVSANRSHPRRGCLSPDAGLLHRHGLHRSADHLWLDRAERPASECAVQHQQPPIRDRRLQGPADELSRGRDLLGHGGAVDHAGTGHLCTHLRCRLKCPPNYACWRKVSGLGLANVCIPTLPGARCTTSIDCWAGECLDSGEGFSLCALPCQSDRDCVPFSDSSRRQYCVPAKGDKKYCMGVSPFAGTFVLPTNFARPARSAFSHHRTGPNPPRWASAGFPVRRASVCPVRGGLPHACFVRDADRSCYPGVLGVTCRRSAECLAGRTCENLPPEDGPPAVDGGPDGGTSPAAERLCTQPCDDDADCLDGSTTGRVTAHPAGAGWHARPAARARASSSAGAAVHCVGASPGLPGTCTER